jgi:oligopeptide transport system substrate-binding protein
MDPETASEYSWIWEYTNVVGAEDFVYGEGAREDVGVRAVDDYTLEVQLVAPTPYFVSLMSFFHFMPVKQAAVEAPGGEDGTWASNPDLVVSNGPYVLVDYKIGEGLKLVKNVNYWNADTVMIDEINGKFLDDSNTAYQAYQAGELDFIPDVPTSEIPRLVAEDPNFYIFPLLGTYYYNFNMDLDMFKDARVRRALTLAIDRQQIVDTLSSGQVPAPGFVPPGFRDDKGNDFFATAGDYGIPTDASGVAEAQQLLADAGYPNGEGFPQFVIMYNTSEGHQTVAELVQEMWKTNLGIETTLENQEWAVFQDTRKAGDYEVSRGGWLTDFMDPSGMLAIFQEGNSYNDPNYFNADFEAAMAAALTATDKAEHFAKLYEAQTILMTDMPIIPVYHYSDTMLASERLVGWDRSVLGQMDFTTATIVD